MWGDGYIMAESERYKMSDFERLTPEVVLIDGKHYRAMNDDQAAGFIWGKEKPVAPRRKYQAILTVSGDSWEDVSREIKFVCNEVIQHGEDCNSVSGGMSTSHIVHIIVDPNMTHDIYIEQLSKYLDELKAREIE